MKIVPLSKAKANLSRYGRMCRKESVVVTVNGVPKFKLVALKDDDDLIDQLLAHNADFNRLLKRRHRERSVSVREARRALQGRN